MFLSFSVLDLPLFCSFPPSHFEKANYMNLDLSWPSRIPPKGISDSATYLLALEVDGYATLIFLIQAICFYLSRTASDFQLLNSFTLEIEFLAIFSSSCFMLILFCQLYFVQTLFLYWFGGFDISTSKFNNYLSKFRFAILNF